MQFLVIMRDGTDDEAAARRQRARPAHLESAAAYQEKGHFLIGGAVLNEAGDMIGSAAVVQFETRAELDAWLATDPYSTGDVWRSVEVLPYRVAPHYAVPPIASR